MLLHPLSGDGCTPPRLFTYPFCYEPHPLAVRAARAVQQHIAATGLMGREHGGKMFGVLVVEHDGGAAGRQLAFLAAYSGLLAGRNDWDYFVPPVFDAQQPDGHFKQTERTISALNHEIDALRHDPARVRLAAERDACAAACAAATEEERRRMAVAKARRDARRAAVPPPAAEELEAMTRESQFMKAELRRHRQQRQQRLDALDARLAALDARIDGLRRRRRQMSDGLQAWLFRQYRMADATGRRRDLVDIFGAWANAMPPAGAGDCCAPKLLQYAYTHGLRPVAMAEFWWGESPRQEVRHHLHFYPACRSKCLPILTHMLHGLDVEPNPLARGAGAEPRVVYADGAMVVVDKPAGMLSVPGRPAAGSPAGADVEQFVRDWLSRRPADAGVAAGRQHPFVRAAHRLDMDTSGLIVVALTPGAYRELQRQFACRETSKRYEAIVDGVPHPTACDGHDGHRVTLSADGREGTVELPLTADLTDRPRQKADTAGGKRAVTRFAVVRTDGRQTLLSLWPLTGRTHQLRLHCAHAMGLGTPIVGDRLYGLGTPAPRMMLHAAELTLTHPVTGARMHFCSGLSLSRFFGG